MHSSKIISFTAFLFACAGCGDASEHDAPTSNAAATSGSPAPTVSPAQSIGQAGAHSEPAAQTPAKPNTPAMPTMPAAAPSSSNSDALSDWKPLVDGAWELQGGEEGYRCARLTVTEDLYIKEFQ